MSTNEQSAAGPLFQSYKLGSITLKNRIVMAPLTRSRAPGNVPNADMAEYYRLRASAGLIITEGTSPSAHGLGYPRIPGCFNQEQAAGWQKVAAAVHQDGGKIFMQLMHTGRVSQVLNMPAGTKVLAPSAVPLTGETWTDAKQMQPYSPPQAMTAMEVQQAVYEYVHAAELAIQAGFDGVELHGANGYLIEQFLNPHTNTRTDIYGGSFENRMRFALEVAHEVAAKIGAGKVGIRVSPYGPFNGMPAYEGVNEVYGTLAARLSALGLAYMHIVDHSSMGAPVVPAAVKAIIRKNFAHTLILSGGYDRARAEQDLSERKGDLIAFGRPFIANPHLVQKLLKNTPLVAPQPASFYTPGNVGYLDYPID